MKSTDFKKISLSPETLSLKGTTGVGLTTVLVLLGSLALSGNASASPLVYSPVYGSLSVDNSTPNLTTITSKSLHTVADWSLFDVGSNETVKVQLPSADATLLNRVTSSLVTTIDGTISVNQGKVFVVNPNGVIVGKNARLDTQQVIFSLIDFDLDQFVKGKLVPKVTIDGKSEISISPGQNLTVKKDGTIETLKVDSKLLPTEPSTRLARTTTDQKFTLSSSNPFVELPASNVQSTPNDTTTSVVNPGANTGNNSTVTGQTTPPTGSGTNQTTTIPPSSGSGSTSNTSTISTTPDSETTAAEDVNSNLVVRNDTLYLQPKRIVRMLNDSSDVSYLVAAGDGEVALTTIKTDDPQDDTSSSSLADIVGHVQGIVSESTVTIGEDGSLVFGETASEEENKETASEEKKETDSEQAGTSKDEVALTETTTDSSIAPPPKPKAITQQLKKNTKTAKNSSKSKTTAKKETKPSSSASQALAAGKTVQESSPEEVKQVASDISNSITGYINGQPIIRPNNVTDVVPQVVFKLRDRARQLRQQKQQESLPADSKESGAIITPASSQASTLTFDFSKDNVIEVVSYELDNDYNDILVQTSQDTANVEFN